MDEPTNVQSSQAPAAEHRTHGVPILGLDRRQPLMRIDLTWNIPTIFSLLAAVVTLAGTGVTLYYGMDRRMLTTEYEITKINKRLEDNERALATVRNEQITQQTTLRAEMKGDIAEIKGMLNQLIFAPQPQRAPQQQLNEWRK
jgi:hypothetical protein